MRTELWAAVVTAALLAQGGGAARAACPSGKAADCVNLNLSPQTTQLIAASDTSLAAAAAKPPPEEPASGYTGPTIGAAPNIPRTPVIGYHWATN